MHCLQELSNLEILGKHKKACLEINCKQTMGKSKKLSFVTSHNYNIQTEVPLLIFVKLEASLVNAYSDKFLLRFIKQSKSSKSDVKLAK